MHNSLGSSEATLALLFTAFCLLRKPKNSLCNKLRAVLHALNHLCSSLKVPTQTTLFTDSSTSFRKQQCECKSFLQGPPRQNPSYTLHPKMQLFLLEGVTKFGFCTYSSYAPRPAAKDFSFCTWNIMKFGIFSKSTGKKQNKL